MPRKTTLRRLRFAFNCPTGAVDADMFADPEAQGLLCFPYDYLLKIIHSLNELQNHPLILHLLQILFELYNIYSLTE